MGIGTIIFGFVVLALGCFLHVVSKGVLIRDVVLCDKGIYSLVRHPYYLANYLIDVSFCLLSGNIFLVLAYPFLFFWAYGPTIRKEEKVLLAGHHDSFMRDSMEIPQVFPDRSSVQNLRSFFIGFSFHRVTLKECARIMKFVGTGTLLLFIHQAKLDGFNGDFASIVPTGPYYSEFWFGIVTVLLYAGSFLFLWRARHEKNDRVEGMKA